MKEEAVEMDGVIEAALANMQFRVKLDNPQKQSIMAYVSGNMRKNFIRVVPGDKVKLEISPYDLTKGRIVFRYK